MATVSTLLDDVQRHLQDAMPLGTDGLIWSRAELLLWLRDGYRKLLAQSQGVRRLTALSVPPRHTMTYTYPWEKDYVMGGTSRQWTYTSHDGRRQTTTKWEIAQREGLDPEAGFTSVTQLWEIAYVTGSVDQHYRFSLPRDHDQLNHVWHDHEPLYGTTTRTLDRFDYAWYRNQGEPQWWLPGLGNTRTFEIHHIDATDAQVYALSSLFGIPRYFSGSRTYTPHTQSATVAVWDFSYTVAADYEGNGGLSGRGFRLTQPTTEDGFACTQVWEAERHAAVAAANLTDGITVGTFPFESLHGAANVAPLPVGTQRRVTSPDRQYLPRDHWADALGTIREWQSSEDNMLVVETVIPSVPELVDDEQSVPDMIFPQCHKYLVYYVWSVAFNRQGEGYNPNLAIHWDARFRAGVQFVKRLENVAWRDAQFQRGRTGRTALNQTGVPQLPSDYPRLVGV